MRLLTRELWFPDPRTALKGDMDGLVAIGGDLSTPRLLLAYKSGIFPWSAEPVTWWSPDPRAVFEMDGFHVSKSFGKFLRNHPYTITRNKAFTQVMEACAEPRSDKSFSWISEHFIQAYTSLHHLGHAHSVEVWDKNTLVGGIYGVHIGGFFAGESMFHRVDNASKLALHHLISHLKSRGFTLFDTQVINPTTAQLGAIEISRESYLERLAHAVSLPCTFDDQPNSIPSPS